jgi:hypothetical protein
MMAHSLNRSPYGKEDTVFDVRMTADKLYMAFKLEHPYGGLKIHWGDGEVTHDTRGSGTIEYTHTYSAPGEYTIQVIPDKRANGAPNWYLLRSGGKASETPFYQVFRLRHLPEHMYRGTCILEGADYLETIDPGVKVTHLYDGTLASMFCYAGRKTTNGTLFPDDFELSNTDVPPFTNGSFIYFGYYAKLRLNPSFKIPARITNLTSAFAGCNLFGFDITNMFPEEWGANPPIHSKITLNGMFSGVTSITGTAPAHLLWDNPYVTMAYNEYTFYNCTKLSNFKQIPGSWGGGRVTIADGALITASEDGTALLGQDIIDAFNGYSFWSRVYQYPTEGVRWAGAKRKFIGYPTNLESGHKSYSIYAGNSYTTAVPGTVVVDFPAAVVEDSLSNYARRLDCKLFATIDADNNLVDIGLNNYAATLNNGMAVVADGQTPAGVAPTTDLSTANVLFEGFEPVDAELQGGMTYIYDVTLPLTTGNKEGQFTLGGFSSLATMHGSAALTHSAAVTGDGISLQIESNNNGSRFYVGRKDNNNFNEIALPPMGSRRIVAAVVAKPGALIGLVDGVPTCYYEGTHVPKVVTATAANTGSFRLGCASGGSSPNLCPTFHNVLVFSSALSVAEIQNITNKLKQLRPSEDPPAAQYTPVGWLKTDASSYIDTGIIAKSGITAEVKMAVNRWNPQSVVLGALDGTNYLAPVSICLYDMTIRCPRFQYGGSTIKRARTVDMIIGQPYVIKSEVKAGRQNTTVADCVRHSETSGTQINTNLPMYLFRCNSSGAPNTTGETGVVIYYCKIWDERNALVRDFIPVLDSNNVPCMFDKVSGEFFYSPGTGSFIYGN